MESPTFETPEIYKNDQKQINKILDEINNMNVVNT